MADQLRAFGADVALADPHAIDAHPERGPLVELSVEELERADAVVLLTDHDDLDLGLVSRHARYVLDTRRRINGGQVELL